MKALKGIWTALALVVALAAFASPSAAQTTTTGALSGNVVDEQGAALPGVTVEAKHTATGTNYETVTNSEGRYEIANIRAGAYTVTAKLSGFKDQVVSNVVVQLGVSQDTPIKMSIAALTESVTVTGKTSDVSSQAGTASNISNDVVDSLPTIQRSITDVARTNPFFN